MIRLRSLISEQTIDYSEMSNDDLWAAYYKANDIYDAQVNRSTEAPINAVGAASEIANSKLDITRPVYDADANKSIYIPATGKKMNTVVFRDLFKAAKAGGEKTLQAFREKTGFTDLSFEPGQTTDNTCAQFACTAWDMGNSMTNDNIGGLLKDQKPLDWDAIMKNPYSGNWREYRSSVDKIKRATIGNTDYTKHPGNWSLTASSDFEGDDRSVEYWNANIRPGDMILYKKSNGRYSHVALAGSNPLELYQDGSTKLTPGQRHNVDNHTNTHKGESFDIIRYTNAQNISNAQSQLNNIQAALDNRKMPMANVEKLQVGNDNGEPIASKLLPSVNIKPKMAGNNGSKLKNIYKSIKGLGDPDSLWR